jgi:hypothetical protein
MRVSLFPRRYYEDITPPTEKGFCSLGNSIPYLKLIIKHLLCGDFLDF